MPGPRFSVTLLVENSAREGFAAEHGLAFWIDTPQGSILFDTGPGGTLASNAQRLNLDLGAAHFLVLSHGHRDHAGAVDQVLAHNDSLMAVFHPEVFRERYVVKPGDTQAIGIPPACAAAIRALPPQRACASAAPMELVPDVGTTGQIPRASPHEETDGRFFLDAEGRIVDDIVDDQALWFLTAKGLVVITGCAHAGLINTVHQARRVTGEHRVAGLIGGFHLDAASEARLEETARVLIDWNVGFVMPCHCTDAAATGFMRAALGSRVSTPAAGDVLEF